jgi:glycosyltransferase involved in cell wall biosynthesis
VKIVHVTHNIHTGGAATYVRRVIRCNEKLGIDQSLIVGSPSGLYSREEILRPGGSDALKIWKARVSNKLDNKLNRLEFNTDRRHRSLNLIGALSGKTLNASRANIVHLHWINHGLISIRQLNRIEKPIVWSSLDMWPFTGGEHYVSRENLSRLKGGYKKDNRNSEDWGIDLEKYCFIQKEKLTSKKLLIIHPSAWLKDISASSKIGASLQHVILPPPVDTDFFRPLERQISDQENTKSDFTIGFGGGLSGRKGWQEVKSLFLNYLVDHNRVKLVHFGGTKADSDLVKFDNYKFVGQIPAESQELIRLINQIDLLLFPSEAEAFGLLAQEAQSCGTPVMCRVGTGSVDTIEVNRTGRVFSSSADLIAQIKYFLELSREELSEMRHQARVRAVKLWSYKSISMEFFKIYRAWEKS